MRKLTRNFMFSYLDFHLHGISFLSKKVSQDNSRHKLWNIALISYGWEQDALLYQFFKQRDYLETNIWPLTSAGSFASICRKRALPDIRPMQRDICSNFELICWAIMADESALGSSDPHEQGIWLSRFMNLMLLFQSLIIYALHGNRIGTYVVRKLTWVIYL